MNLKEVKSLYRQRLQNLYSEREADRLFFIFLEELWGLSVTGYFSQQQEEPSPKVEEGFKAALARLEKCEPYQHILGWADFAGLRLKVSKSVLVPRPETEELLQFVKEKMDKKPGLKILDIGTGSGCLALGCSAIFTGSQVTGIDISEDALSIARQNSDSNKLQVRFLNSDFLNSSDWPAGEWDLIVSNPPYISAWESSTMDDLVVKNEPWQALFVDDADPLIFYRQIAAFAQSHLTAEGHIFLEINERLGAETLAVFTGAGFVGRCHRDLSGKDRFVVAKNKKPHR